MASRKKAIQEFVQFLPVIGFASSFLVTGDVDLERAGPLFIISALGAVAITAVLLRRRVLLNPILFGSNLWLCLGAVAFGVPIPPLAGLLGQLQATALYVCIFSCGLVFSTGRPTGYIGMRHADPRVIRKLSAAMMGLTAIALVWSHLHVDNIRLGGGLPFIILNVTRRVMIRRARR